MNISKTGHFNFDCQLCGECCTGSMKVQLNLYDLYKIARHLNLNSSRTLFQKGYAALIETDQKYWIPVIKFRKWTVPYCPFLINSLDEQEVLHGLCSLHPHDKPLICSMAPLGRVIDFQKQTIEYRVTAPLKDCPGMTKSEQNSVQEILINHEKELKYQYAYYQLLDNLYSWEASKEIYLNEIYSFDTNTSFEESFESIKIRAESFMTRKDIQNINPTEGSILNRSSGA